VGFVILALASSTLISLPLSTDPPDRIRALYAQHRTAYVVAQIVGLLGVALFVRFLLGLRSRPAMASSAVFWSGIAVAAAAVSTNLPVLLLSLGPPLGALGTRRSAVASDVTDDVLFFTYGLFAVALARSGLHPWLRRAAWLSAVLCLLRAFSWVLPLPGLEVLAPICILGLLLAIAIGMIRRPREGRRPASTPLRVER
jgi:hypothetical protein